jgi:hypothetical protein
VYEQYWCNPRYRDGWFSGEYLKGDQQHIGNMFQVIGSRLGFIVGGGAILWAMDWLSWQNTFLILAGIVALNTIPIWFYQEPEHLKKAASHLQHQAAKHFIENLNLLKLLLCQ